MNYIKYPCSPDESCGGFTPLMIQIVTGAPLIIQDINAKNDLGWTALMIATRNSSKYGAKLISTLIEEGADLNLQDNEGWTALMIAVAYLTEGSSVEAIQLLVQAGADLNLQDNDGWTALMLTTTVDDSPYSNSSACIDLLIQAGASVNIQDNEGYTVLMYATLCTSYSVTNIRILQRLIQSGADVNLQNNEGNTALMLAADHSSNNRSSDVIELLIYANADPNLRNKQGMTALMMALFIEEGAGTNIETINFLIRYGSIITFTIAQRIVDLVIADKSSLDQHIFDLFNVICSPGLIRIASAIIYSIDDIPKLAVKVNNYELLNDLMKDSFIMIHKIHILSMIFDVTLKEIIKTHDHIMKYKFIFDKCMSKIPIAYQAFIHVPGRSGYTNAKSHYESMVIL